jgi:hypothetical protein
MEFSQASIMLGWNRAGGRIASFLGDESIWLAHYDPFAARPVYREPLDLPLGYGPISGSASFLAVDGGVEVQWTLKNHDFQEVAFLPLRSPVEIWELARGGDELIPANKFGRASAEMWTQSMGQGDPALEHEWWKPGEHREGRLFVPDVTLAEGGERWQAQFPCDLPRDRSGGRVATLLHVLWDPVYGASIGFDDPFADVTSQRKWSPYSVYSTRLTITAVFDFHGTKAVGIVNPHGDGVDLRFQTPEDHRVVMANRLLPWEKTPPIWLRSTDGTRHPLPEALPVIDQPLGIIPAELLHYYERLRPGAFFGGFSRSLLFGSLRGSQPPSGYASQDRHPWELLMPIPVPSLQLRRTTEDLRAEWWHVSFDPMTGPQFRRFDK